MNLLAGRRHRERSCRHREERVGWPGKLALTFMYNVCVRAKSRQSCPTLCDSIDCSLPGSSVYGTLQARILEWVVIPFSRGSFWPRDRTRVSYVSCIGRWVLYHCATWEAHRSGGRTTILKIQIGLLHEYLIKLVEWLIQLKKKELMLTNVLC